MTTISARVIAHSITKEGLELSTTLTRSPLSYHPQNMTHRVFSRNASSARAVPTSTIIQRIIDDPVYPVRWTKNQPGMQGWNDLNYTEANACKTLWDYHRKLTISITENINKLGLHKQYANRLLTPHQHIDVLWTTVGWKNFFHLRDHPDAQPEEQLFAQAVREALEVSEPKLLKPGEWHLPWIREEDWELGREYLGIGNINSPANDENLLDLMKNISASRCATLSYGNADGSKSNFEKDIARINKLMTDPLHASPFEHQATPDTKTFIEKYKYVDDQLVFVGSGKEWDNPELHGNLTGFIQYRKTLPNESVRG